MRDINSDGARLAETFAPVRLWVFDLDNTLYPAASNLFAQVDQRMSKYIQDLLGLDSVEARRVQKSLYYEHGTTLAGLMKSHGIAPDHFLDYVHDIDLASIEHTPALAEEISKLEGSKFIFTNGSTGHAERIAEKLGVLQEFDGIFDIKASGYVPKPKPDAFAGFMSFCGESAKSRGAMFEDLPHNLEAAHAYSLVTVLVRSSYLDHPSQHAVEGLTALPDYIDFETTDLTAFLQAVNAALSEVRPRY